MSWPTFVCASSYSIAALLVAKLTPADVTPPAPVSASRTVAAQLAQVMPSMGRTMRALLMGPPSPPPPPPRPPAPPPPPPPPRRCRRLGTRAPAARADLLAPSTLLHPPRRRAPSRCSRAQPRAV